MMRESLSDSKSKRDRAMVRERSGSGMDKFCSVVRMTAAACALCLLLAACGMSTEEQWQKQYDLGEQYLLDGDYEQAIVAFSEAIEIDANRAEAYLARAEAYLASDTSYVSETNVSDTETSGGEAVILSDWQEAALADYLTAIGLDDTLEDAYIGAAGLYVAAGEDDLAMELLLSYPVGEDDIPEQIAAMLEGLSNQTGKESLCIKSSGEGYYYLYEYDAYGNCLLVNHYIGDTLSSYEEYFYDESGNEVLWILCNLDGTLNNWGVLFYDRQGNMTALTACDADGTGYALYEYEYDSDGNLTAGLGYNESGSYRDVYTDDKLTARYDYDESGNLESYTIYEKDDAGNRTGYTSYYADGTAWRWVEYEYVYDEEGYCQRSVMKVSYESPTVDFSDLYIEEYTVVEVLPWDETAAEAGRAAGYVLTEEEIAAVINGEWLPGTAS